MNYVAVSILFKIVWKNIYIFRRRTKFSSSIFETLCIDSSVLNVMSIDAVDMFAVLKDKLIEIWQLVSVYHHEIVL